MKALCLPFHYSLPFFFIPLIWSLPIDVQLEKKMFKFFEFLYKQL